MKIFPRAELQLSQQYSYGQSALGKASLVKVNIKHRFWRVSNPLLVTAAAESNFL